MYSSYHDHRQPSNGGILASPGDITRCVKTKNSSKRTRFQWSYPPLDFVTLVFQAQLGEIRADDVLPLIKKCQTVILKIF